MSRDLIAVDIDGTLTTDRSPLIRGYGPAGNVIWPCLKKAGIARWLMKRAQPDPIARDWLWMLRTIGHVIAYRTGREEINRDVTEPWLAQHQFPPGAVDMLQPREDLAAHKAECGRSQGYVLAIDDSLDNCRAILDRLGPDAPLVLHCADWAMMSTYSEIKGELRDARAGTQEATKLLADLNTQGLPAALKQVISQVQAQVLAQGGALARIEGKFETLLEHADAGMQTADRILEDMKDAPQWVQALIKHFMRVGTRVSNAIQAWDDGVVIEIPAGKAGDMAISGRLVITPIAKKV
jgi:hypothetical protein